MYRRILITGVGVVAPSGLGKDHFLEALLRGSSLVRSMSCIDADAFKVKIAAEVPVTEFAKLHPDRHIAFAVHAASEALEHGGINAATTSRTGVSFATTVAGARKMERVFQRGRAEAPEVFRFGTVSEEVARRYKLSGVNLTVTTGCTAGLDAFGIACDQIRAGRADCMLTGAADAPITPIVVAAFDRIQALSRRNDEPAAASRPFDLHRDGLVLGEGAAAFVLEEWEHAKARKARPLAEVLGWSSVSSAYHMTGMRTDGSDIVRVIERALNRSGIRADQVDLVDLHGTSTQINDRAEAAAITRVFGPPASQPPATAQKSINGSRARSFKRIRDCWVSLSTRTRNRTADSESRRTGPRVSDSPCSQQALGGMLRDCTQAKPWDFRNP